MHSGRRRHKILFLIHSLGFGGAERQLSYLASGLKQRGHDVSVAVFYPQGPYFAELRGAGVRIVSLDKRGRLDLLSFTSRLLRLVRRERPDVIYGFMPMENLAALIVARLVRPRIPVVWGIRASDVDATVYGLLSTAVYKLQEWLVRAPDLVISNSHAAFANPGLKVPPNRAMVIPNGIDVARFCPDTALHLAGRGILGIDGNGPVVAIVGRLDPMKGHECFLRAAEIVARHASDARFLVVGSGSHAYRLSMMRIADGLGIGGRLIWRDAFRDIEVIYNSIDVLVSSSIFGEGFPNVVAEAMACGAAVVACSVGDAARVMGTHGHLVPRADPEALAAAVLEALASRSVQRAAARREWIVDKFSIDRLVTDTEAALAAVVGAGTL